MVRRIKYTMGSQTGSMKVEQSSCSYIIHYNICIIKVHLCSPKLAITFDLLVLLYIHIQMDSSYSFT